MSPEALKVRQRRTARLVLGFVATCLASVLFLSGDGITGAALAQETTPDKSSASESASPSRSDSGSPSGSASPSGSGSPSSSQSQSASPSGSSSPTQSSPPRPASRTVTLEASRSGTRVSLAGQVFSEDSSCQDFELVEIRRRVHGTTSETDFIEVETGMDGSFSVTFRPRQSADYRAVAPDHDRCAGAASSPVTFLVRVTVRISASDRSPRRGDVVRFVVKVAPEHPGTRVVLERKKGKRFVWVAAADLDEDSWAVFRVSANWRGTRKFRARWANQDDDHEAGTSRVLEIRVGTTVIR
jgi:hypothetical protein